MAAIAAVVSQMHVATLALVYGQPPLAAYLLPLSIDGLVAASSLVLLRSARAGVSAPWLARTGLVLAVVARLAANVASGAAHGWPAVAFVISAETAIAMSGRRVAKVATERPEATPNTCPAKCGQAASGHGHRGGHPGHPAHWRTWAAAREHVKLAAARHGHAAAYHGVRAPAYLVLMAWWALVGIFCTADKVLAWWHVPDLGRLERRAAVDGLLSDHLRIHQAGK